MNTRFVAYYRVSTARQGASGLGLAAQRRAVGEYLERSGGTLVASYEEVESGKRADRPALAEAMERCRLTNARLLIAKLDRLSRNVHFLTGLEEEGVDFVACDMPQANRLTVHIMAAVAQQEREAISTRTKAALGEIKARLKDGLPYASKKSGRPVTRLGNPAGLSVSRRDLGPAAAAAKADAFAARVQPIATRLRAEGLSLAHVAAQLDEMHIDTPRGKGWTAMGVKRLLDRRV
ncbi:recombinase family protein [Caulobacter sp. DWR2-3-1b2]|uniref:recombinase family protein n=1 Tax=unclassified Caulobacter TaxID=2648921 RepID=UPI003CF6B0A1